MPFATPRFSTIPCRFASLFNGLALLRAGTALLLGLAMLGVSAGPATAQSITSFQPESGAPGTQVRVYGSSFSTSGGNTVTFGGTSATVDSAKANVIYAKVPSEVNGLVQIEVMTGGTTVTATNPFSALRGGTDVFAATDVDSEVGGSVIRKGDYDDDGDLDLALIDKSDDLRIYRNDGDSFTAIGTGLGEHETMEWGDFDNDGDLDLAATGQGFSGSTVLYENTGQDTFEAVGASLTNVTNSALDWGDFDGDGDLDLLIAGEDADGNVTTTLYENEGGGTFSSVSTTVDGVYRGDVAWGDFDTDGDLDLVVTGASPGEQDFLTKVYRNDGQGTLTLVESLTPSLRGESLDWGDFNGDGDLDLVVSGTEDDGIGFVPAINIYENDGDGNLSPVLADVSDVRGVAKWGDFNADGLLDLAVTGDEAESGEEASGVSEIYLNEGSGEFRLSRSLRDETLSDLEWGDFDGDGLLDLVLTSTNNVVGQTTVYRNLPATPVPSGLAATPTTSEISLSWSAGGVASGLEKYRIYRSTTPIDTSDGTALTPLDSVQVGTTSYTDTGLEEGTSYYYRVTAVSSVFGESAFSSQLVATTERTLAVTGVRPSSGATGTQVRIQGTNFDPTASNNTVTIGGAEANIDSAKANVIYAKVPSGESGPVDVSVSSGGATTMASDLFTVLTGGGTSFINADAHLGNVPAASFDWGDVDNDGDRDLLTTGPFVTPATAVYRTEPTRTFAPLDSIFADVSGAGGQWGDYDGDGDLDVAVSGERPNTDDGFSADEESTIIYRNEGNGTFTPIGAGISAIGPPRWGDYDNDGDLDLIVGSVLYRNDGGDTFTKVTEFNEDADVQSVDWGDYDSDGDLDLLLTGSVSTNTTFNIPWTQVWRNDGDGSFTSPTDIDITDVDDGEGRWGDYDNDGDLDVVIVGRNDNGTTAKIYRNDGGTFTPIDADLTGVVNGAVSWGDLDGGGDLDLAVTGDANGDPAVGDDGGHSTTVYRNDGGGTFSPVDADIAALRDGATDWEDYDKDGDLDLLVAGEDTSGTRRTILYRNGDLGTPEEIRVTDLQPEQGASGTSVHVNGVGFSPTANDHTVTFGGTTATVDSSDLRSLYVTAPDNTRGPVTVSIDNGRASTTVTKSFSGVTGGGESFSEVSTSIADVQDSASDWGDYDGDGDMDLVLIGNTASGFDDNPTTTIYRNDGDGSFTAIQANLTGVNDGRFDSAPIGTVDWGDYDNDGDLDLFVTGEGSDTQSFIYRNDGNDTFTALSLPADLGGDGTWVDYDEDGDLDLVVGGSIYRNEGDDEFTVVEVDAPIGGTMDWTDFDGDGDMDILTGGDTIYRNEGGGEFVEVETDLGDHEFGVWGDFDNDGDPDIVAVGEDTDFNATATIYRNEGDGTFTPVDGADLTGVSDAYTADWGDYDGDGDLDLVITGRDADFDATTTLYENEGGGSFTPVDFSVADFTAGSASWADIEGDGDLDLLLTGGESVETAIYENQKSVVNVSAPTGLVATTTDAPTVDLEWSAVDDQDALLRYRLYRDTAPITGSPSDRLPFDSTEAGTTTFTDEPEPGTTYYYRVTAVDTAGAESGFSGEASAFLYPQEVTASASRTFGGATDSTGYRLVALPGQADRSIADAVSGEAGAQWNAYYDDGSESDFLVEFDGSEAETFTFQKGNGFWLTATSEWTFEESISTVDLRGDSATAIALRDGWNVISNPFGKDVDWAAVEQATAGSLQPIWAFDGSFGQAQTFASAASGTAYYFFNDESSRDSLVIPYPGAPGGSGSDAAPKTEKEPAPMLAVTATPAEAESASASTVRLGIREGAARGVGADDLIAPPGRFAKTSLRIEAPGEADSERSRFLMTERRPPAEDGGRTFKIRLASRSGGPVKLQTQNLDAIEDRSVVLLHPSVGKTYDLREKEAVVVEPRKETTSLKVAIGTEGYVNEKASEVVPEEVRITSYPNPIGQQGTIEYALPEKAKVTLRVYDVLGRQVATLAQGRKDAGRHAVRLETGRLSSGVYFGRLQVGDQTLTQKITVVR